MYRYDFSAEELRRLQKKIELPPKEVKNIYVFFNNENCYNDGKTLQEMMAGIEATAK